MLSTGASPSVQAAALAVWAPCRCMFCVTRVVAVLWLDGAMPLLCCMFCGACALLGGVLCRCYAAYSGPLVWCVCSGWVCLCCAPCFQSAVWCVCSGWVGAMPLLCMQIPPAQPPPACRPFPAQPPPHVGPSLCSPPLHAGPLLHSLAPACRPSLVQSCMHAIPCTALPPCRPSPVQPCMQDLPCTALPERMHALPLIAPRPACRSSPAQPPPHMPALPCTAPPAHAGFPLHRPPGGLS